MLFALKGEIGELRAAVGNKEADGGCFGGFHQENESRVTSLIKYPSEDVLRLTPEPEAGADGSLQQTVEDSEKEAVASALARNSTSPCERFTVR